VQRSAPQPASRGSFAALAAFAFNSGGPDFVVTAIRLERVTKRYRVGRSRTIVDVIASNLDRLRRRDRDVFSAARGRIPATVYALSDVSLDIDAGTGLGIIGANGAGKTTLLKLISRVTWPTSGRVQVAGRVVSLIELGAGFHPELTGRENVYLGAGLFGLTRRDIDRCFDEIVQFAEVEQLIDTPMKRYSSGLYARLGFSVAIHSNPDIVLVDEVLAVGDAAFRRRALESLRQLIDGGKTVLFISHDLWNVRRLCERMVWLDEGRVRASGAAAEVADQYVEEMDARGAAGSPALPGRRAGTGEIRFSTIDILDADGRPVDRVREGATLVIRAGYEAARRIPSPVFQVGIVDVDTGITVATATSSPSDGPSIVDASGAVDCIFESLPLRPRHYALRLSIADARQAASYDVVAAGPRFAVVAAGSQSTESSDGFVVLPYRFEHRVRVLS
jgi:ABC-type polysaccharide/polyol phosphate transport system ATPase subunit